MDKVKVNTVKLTDEQRMAFGSLGSEEVLKQLDSRKEGLTSKEVQDRFAINGVNEIPREKEVYWFVRLMKAYVNPFSGIMFFLSLVTLFTNLTQPAAQRNYATVIIIFIIISISGFLKFIQEGRSEKETKKLESLTKNLVDVIRDNKDSEIDLKDLVPGDIVKLNAGSIIPADARIIENDDLFVSQAMMTGESLPAEKTNKAGEGEHSLFDWPSLLFMGTHVVSGSATAVILNTGARTYLGAVARHTQVKRGMTSFEKGVNSVSMLLIRFMFVMVPIVFLLNGFLKGNWLEALLFSLSVAVGLTPEMLPMIVTTNLAKGAVALANKKTIVRRLESIQTFGEMDVLCTDKTGTLTQDNIQITRFINAEGNEDLNVLIFAYLNSTFQTGMKGVIDRAIVTKAEEANLTDKIKHITKVDEIPFDFQRRRLSVLLTEDNEQHELVTKGAIQEIFDVCTKVRIKGEDVPFTQEHKEELQKLAMGLNEGGMRDLAVAYKVDDTKPGQLTVADESDMTLIGLLGMYDPPKETAADALKLLKQQGIAIKVLTGDNAIVTAKICGLVGLDAGKMILGSDLDKIDDAKLNEMVEETTIFCKLTPLQKERIVHSLRLKHTVGYMGDGINDAPALHAADVGISVDTAVDIAKAAADIILLEKDLHILATSVTEGRKIFGNIVKYIKMTSSSNFGNMLSVLVASAFLPFLPMIPLQILLLNLIYDISQTAIPWDNVDASYLLKARKWDASSIRRFMLIVGPTSSVFDIATFLLLWFVFGFNKVGDPNLVRLFQTGWFIESLLSQTLVIHLIRTEKIPFIQSRASWQVLLMTSILLTIGVILPFSPISGAISMAALPPAYFGYLTMLLLGYGALIQITKYFYIRRFHQWL
jgi:P-type Mg2+ transporter